MVIRFKYMPAMANDLRHELNRLIIETCGPEGGFTENGVSYTVFSLGRQMHVQPNGDLFIDDDLDEIIYGYILQGLRAKSYLVEQGEIIVPQKVTHPENYTPPIEFNDVPVEDDNIVQFEDFLPDSAFDDGHFEEEMREIMLSHQDDDE